MKIAQALYTLLLITVISGFILVVIEPWIRHFYIADKTVLSEWYPRFYVAAYILQQFLLFIKAIFWPVLAMGIVVVSRKVIFTKNGALLIATFTIMFVIAEISLRFFGIQPGQYISSQWFTEVDKLTLKEGFDADSNGIFRVSDKTVKDLSTGVKTNNYSYSDMQVAEVYGLIYDTYELNQGKIKNDFVRYVETVKRKKEKTSFDTALIEYATAKPVNDDGFRSVAFKNYNTNKKKVLLIGDSFTWGHSAEPLSNCFADELLAKGYIVYNTGISGADPAQYLAIAREYIPLLKPDVVIVNFFMGNDVLFYWPSDSIKYFKRHIEPYKPIHYNTNAGNILACPQGIYLGTPDSAYQFTVSHHHIPSKTTFGKFCSLTSCATILWKALHKFNYVSGKVTDYDWYWKKVESNLSDVPTCNEELAEIDSMCKAHGSNFYLVPMDNVHRSKANKVEEAPHLFENMKYYQSPVKQDGYNMGDGHFNNKGHKQYADFLQQLIETSSVNKK